MLVNFQFLTLVLFTLAVISSPRLCNSEQAAKGSEAMSFGDDYLLLEQHTDAIALRRGQAAIVVVPEYQGRVMTATAMGDSGPSSGWINYELVKQGVVSESQAKGTLAEHMYAFGGEERFWLGPEGGQYAIFFATNAKFTFDEWFTPDPIDNEPWSVDEQSSTSVRLSHSFQLQNHSGTRFQVRAERTIELLSETQLESMLGGAVTDEINLVAYRSTNKVTNSGDATWEKEGGLLSIWMLSMLKPSPQTTVFVPFQRGDEVEFGKIVSDDYFGKVTPDRLKVGDGVLYFKCDGLQRGKIGLSPERAKGVAGSYDPKLGRLTLLSYQQPESHRGYVNSKWEWQDQPYQGDAINSYNDGPVGEEGEQMGPFYELEASSPALALAPGQSAEHIQTVMHCYGDREQLQLVLDKFCDTNLDEVEKAFSKEGSH